MKVNKLYKGLAAFALVGMLTGCSSDYLDVSPTTSFTEDEILSSTTGVNLAIGGLVEAMNSQYSSLDWNGNCGEAYVGNVLSDAMGPDLVSGLWGNYSSMGNWQIMPMEYAYASAIGWTYYYTLISLANRVIDYVHVGDDGQEVMDATSDELTQYEFYLAQALTFRAHAYQKLMALYGPRFEDSKDGAANSVVLRLSSTYTELPLSSYREVMDQIYADLDRALALYDESGMDRDSKTSVNANVAHGIYARAAMMDHKWDVAQEHAAAARKGYTIMDADTYLSGFTADCSDYIWHMDGGYDTTYYWSFGSHNACNGGYVNAWAFGAGAINLDLYRDIYNRYPTDIRLKLYITPEKVTSLKKYQNVGGITEADFWDKSAVDATDVFLNLITANQYDSKDNNSKAAGMYNAIAWLCYNYVENDFKGDIDRFASDDNFYNYCYRYSTSSNSGKDLMVKKGIYIRMVKTPLGAQMKFWGDVPYGNMEYPWMRASEMCLTEAEAYYMMGDEANAKKCLTELMSKRVSGYSCTTSGDELLEEIRVNRRMELFMEGQNFTDFKRWNVPVERRSWVAGDPTSGNAVNFQVMPLRETSAANGWRWHIPYKELQYNSAIDQTTMYE